MIIVASRRYVLVWLLLCAPQMLPLCSAFRTATTITRTARPRSRSVLNGPPPRSPSAMQAKHERVVDARTRVDEKATWEYARRAMISFAAGFAFLLPFGAHSDDELARYAAQGNAVGVDGTCFIRKCVPETLQCGGDQTCLKGLSCLARCKGDSTCSTGCFAKYGSPKLDAVIACGVETNDCVHVPRGETHATWTDDTDGVPTRSLQAFDMKSMEGTWYKVLGLDTRYDCFDCQSNTFSAMPNKIDSMKMTARFRMPRPKPPGYYENIVTEEVHKESKNAPSSLVASSDGGIVANGVPQPSLRSRGHMFGLTFWENWYVLGDSDAKSGRATESQRTPGASSGRKPFLAQTDSNQFPKAVYDALLIPGASADGTPSSDMANPKLKLIYYTGHTLQGTYKGAFLYASKPQLSRMDMQKAFQMVREAGLDPSKFCLIRNQCFLTNDASDSTLTVATKHDAPWWFVGQRFFRATRQVAEQLAEWFEDPTITSEWLLQQQVRMVINEPMQVSPFGGQIVSPPLQSSSDLVQGP